MIKIDLNSAINRPVDEVWKSLTNPSVAKQWMSGLLQVSSISEGPWNVGTKILKVQRFVGLRTEMVYDTTVYEPNRKLAYKTVSGTLSGPLSYEASITLESIESGTKLIYTGRGELRGFFKLVEPVFTRWARRRFKNDFNTFKVLLKAQGYSAYLHHSRSQIGAR
ncbi:MAG: SRPBCC family protein [Thaumarchaeota archaeon]|nr:SRPBCC family protein [Nitrososphaerota archaeon]